MRTFVTGASGWVGRGLVPDLIEHGHTVTGLARSEASAEALRAVGAKVVLGSIDDLELLGAEAATADGVIHLAFQHELAFSGNFAAASAADRVAIDTFGDALAGSGKPFVIASGILGVLGLPPGVVATERDGLAAIDGDGKTPIAGANERLANAHRALALAERGVRSSVVRLPPATHGAGDNGFTAVVVRSARAAGASVYIGDGANRWPAVHRDDAARLFRLALESTPAGSVLHAVAEEGVPIRQVAEAVASVLDVHAVSIAPDEAGAYLGFLSGFWGVDGPASSAITRELVGWEPRGPGLIADIAAGQYVG